MWLHFLLKNSPIPFVFKGLQLFPAGTFVVASLYETKFSRRKLVERLKRYFDRIYPVQDTHCLIVKYFPIIITTNYDHLLESAFRAVEKPFEPAYDEKSLSLWNEREKSLLLKVHGDFDHLDHLVITEKDYLTKRWTDTVISLLRFYVANRGLVFIGYSLWDYPIDQLIGSIYRELTPYSPPFYLVIQKAEDSPRLVPLVSLGVQPLSMTADEFLKQIERDAASIPSPQRKPKDEKTLIDEHLDWVAREFQSISIFGRKEKFKTDEIYIQLRLVKEIPPHERSPVARRPGKLKDSPFYEEPEEKKVYYPEEAVGEFRALRVEGVPGAGKTTLMQYLAYRNAQDYKAKAGQGFIPLYVPAYRLSETKDFPGALADFIHISEGDKKRNLTENLIEGECLAAPGWPRYGKES